MSKRFGRNQKRRMREAVAKAERKADYWEDRNAQDMKVMGERLNKTLGSLHHLEAEMHDWAQRIMFALGETSAFARKFAHEVAEPWQIKLLLDPAGWQVHVPETLRYSIRGPDAVIRDTAYNVCRLFPLFVDKIDDEHRYRRIIEFRVGPEDRHKLYYAIDLRTLQQIAEAGERHPLMRYMTYEMVRMATSRWEPKKEKKRG